MEKKTIIDLFESSVKRFPGNPFLWEKTGKRFEPTTYSKVRDLVYEEGAGLVSLGVRKGDNMALLSEGRNRMDHRRAGHVLRRGHQCPPIHQARGGE